MMFLTESRYALERQTCWNILIILITLGMTELFLFQGFVRPLPISMSLLPYLAVLVVGLALAVGGLWYVRSFTEKATCMTGCMTAMVLSMGAGFSLGAVIGATNGMLYGSLYGLIAGMTLGVLGAKCGSMGMLQGLMSGFMGGVMGAMTAVMLANDFLLGFLGVLLAVNGLFLMFLFRVVREDMGSTPSVHSPSLSTYLIITILILVASTWLIAFGPRSTFSLVFIGGGL